MQDSEDQTTGGGADTTQQDGTADNTASLANGAPETTPKKPTNRKKANSAADTSSTGDAESAAQSAGTDAVQGDQSGATNTTQTDQANTDAQGSAIAPQDADTPVGDATQQAAAATPPESEAKTSDADVAAPAGSAKATLEQGGDTQYQYSHEENYPFFGSASEAGAALTDTPKESGVIKVYNKGRIKIEPITKIRLGSLVATDIPFKTAAERDQILASIKSLNQLKNTLTTQVIGD